MLVIFNKNYDNYKHNYYKCYQFSFNKSGVEYSCSFILKSGEGHTHKIQTTHKCSLRDYW